MRQTDRLSSILERLAADGSVAVGELASRLGASAATVRRDLQLLEDQRMLNRTHGGAVARDVLESIHPHPTLSETVMESAELAYGAATHVAKPRKVAR